MDQEYATHQLEEWLSKAVVEALVHGGTAYFFECLNQAEKWERTARQETEHA